MGGTKSINKYGYFTTVWDISDWMVTNFSLFLLGSKFFGSFLARYAESHVGGVGL